MLDGGTYLRAVKQPNDVGNIFLLGSFRKYIYFIGSLLLHFGVIKELIVVHYATNYL